MRSASEREGVAAHIGGDRQQLGHGHLENVLAGTLLNAGRRTPDKVAIDAAAGPTTFGELDNLSAQFAHALVDRGVTRGDRVAVQLVKRPEVVALNIACARLGAIYVPLNSSYVDAEVGALLDDVAPALLVREDPLVHSTPRVGGDELIRGASRYPSAFVDAPCDDATPAAILFTSGTTGQPKGVVLTHGNLSFGCRTLNEAWEMSASDVLVHVLPLFHVHGLFVAAYCGVSSGATLRFLDGFDVADVVTALDGATVMMGVPTQYTRLLADERFTSEGVRSVRLFVSGSAPMLRRTHDDFLSRTGQRVLERYGMTETGMITANPLRGERRPDTVGPALPGVEVRVNGSPGEVEVRGPNVFNQYWNRPGLRESDFTPDGFFRTGDVGMLDRDGYLELVGRSRDLIITGGLNVYPKELEQLIDELPGVLESAVVGVPDDDFGECVTAVLVARPGEVLDVDDLRRRCRSVLAPFKIPKHFVVLDELPRNAMGKVEKARLRRDIVGVVASRPRHH